jgi:hypothetical protein
LPSAAASRANLISPSATRNASASRHAKRCLLRANRGHGVQPSAPCGARRAYRTRIDLNLTQSCIRLARGSPREASFKPTWLEKCWLRGLGLSRSDHHCWHQTKDALAGALRKRNGPGRDQGNPLLTKRNQTARQMLPANGHILLILPTRWQSIDAKYRLRRRREATPVPGRPRNLPVILLTKRQPRSAPGPQARR